MTPDVVEGELVSAQTLSIPREVVIHTPRGPVTATEGENFMDAILRSAKTAGLTHIRIFAGNLEVSDPSEAPAVIRVGEVYRIDPYDPVG